MSRMASATSIATSNIVRALQRFPPASPASQRWLSTLITACVPARLPELSKTITRSHRRSNTVILQNRATLSMPALVRESDAKIIPVSSVTPMQYVIPSAYSQLISQQLGHRLQLLHVLGDDLADD